MSGDAFKLGSFVCNGRAITGLVLEDGVVELAAAVRAQAGKRAPLLNGPLTIRALLDDWDRKFDHLQTLAAFARFEGLPRLDEHKMRPLPPVAPAGRMLYAAANYRDHVVGMRRTFTSGLPEVKDAPAPDDRTRLNPYLFVKACAPTGAQDHIVLPDGPTRIDWEAELAVVMGSHAKNVTAARAMNYVAGFMTTNDVSCRDRTWREDRPGIRSDWLAGKSWDSFAPMGPYLVPRAFVPEHANLAIKLWVNGTIKQDGNSSDMTFTAEEQIEYAARMITLEPGDIFATGTPSGTGQERLEFLKPGDVVETEVEHCGRQRNRVVTADGEGR